MAPGAQDDTSDLVDRAVAAAAAAPAANGSLWVSEPHAVGTAVVPYEAYSLLGALAVRTEGVRLGVVAEGTQRRAPSILAKIVTGVDVISHGRAVLSLDADGGDGTDAGRLSEALDVSRAVLEDDLPTFTGRIYAVAGAVNRPAPVQTGGVPIVVFLRGHGPDLGQLLEVAVPTADAVVMTDGPAAVRAAVDAVARHTRPVEVLALVPPGGTAPSGTVDALASAGATGFLVGVPWPWDTEAVGALADRVRGG
jgi:alkanesulfonate monooxygenase SsuD/methylene tetrahydromethanopterin reductase-like flavin-dependent oxidoreductase (luciferase family)